MYSENVQTACSSDNIDQLATALANVHLTLTNVTKDKDNAFYNSKYSDLASVLNACRVILAQNGLSVVQITKTIPTDKIGQDRIYLVTRLVHSSGQWIAGEYPIIPVKDTPQGYGSALTYARRYTLSALVGIAQDDDDGNLASDVSASSKNQKHGSAQSNFLTDKQRFELMSASKKHHVGHELISEYVKNTYGVTSTRELNIQYFDELMDWIVNYNNVKQSNDKKSVINNEDK